MPYLITVCQYTYIPPSYYFICFLCVHYIIIYSFSTRTLTNSRYALISPASHGCSFVNGARKEYVCFAAAFFSFALITSSCYAKIIKHSSLFSLHNTAFFFSHMVIAKKMHHTMCYKKCKFSCRCMSIFFSLFNNLFN